MKCTDQKFKRRQHSFKYIQKSSGHLQPHRNSLQNNIYLLTVHGIGCTYERGFKYYKDFWNAGCSSCPAKYDFPRRISYFFNFLGTQRRPGKIRTCSCLVCFRRGVSSIRRIVLNLFSKGVAH